MPTVSYETMSDTALEAKRNEIQLQIENLRNIFMALGQEQERRRREGISVAEASELRVQLNTLKAQLEAQEPVPLWKKLFGGKAT